MAQLFRPDRTRAIEKLTDFASVGAGLLVRQNYTDDDIGHSKADSLAERLRMVAPEVTVTVNHASSPSLHTIELLHSDDGIVIDTTVSRAISQMLEQLGPRSWFVWRCVVIARVRQGLTCVGTCALAPGFGGTAASS